MAMVLRLAALSPCHRRRIVEASVARKAARHRLLAHASWAERRYQCLLRPGTRALAAHGLGPSSGGRAPFLSGGWRAAGRLPPWISPERERCWPAALSYAATGSSPSGNLDHRRARAGLDVDLTAGGPLRRPLLYAAEQDAFDVVALQGDEEQQDGGDGQHGSGHHQLGVQVVLTAEVGEADREGVHAAVGEHDQGPGEVVPGGG